MKPELHPIPFNAQMLTGRGVERPTESYEPNYRHNGNCGGAACGQKLLGVSCWNPGTEAVTPRPFASLTRATLSQRGILAPWLFRISRLKTKCCNSGIEVFIKKALTNFPLERGGPGRSL
ncbi:hypothetical protein CYPRO_1988 [Cyclonatronum proteinivorum]|uniref:Uncharacterized protein n=1 Tax=Cyclonatronum proteinivorum TaxID=1457365 RepID=A0A345UL86_9BACT|nr:hypothetical protein CYPRO_1988 [Cyclonatronum proteinivorum]